MESGHISFGYHGVAMSGSVEKRKTGKALKLVKNCGTILTRKYLISHGNKILSCL